MLAQGFSAALDGIRFKVNVVSQTGHQNRQPGQRVVVFGISVCVPICGGLDGLQLADVLVRNAGGRCNVGQGGIVACARFFHAVAHVTSGAGQLLYRGHCRIGRCCQCRDERNRSGNCHRCKRQRSSKASQRAGEQRCRYMSQLDAGRNSGQRSNQAAQRDRSGGNALDHAGVFLDKALHPAQNLRANIVQAGHGGSQILADGDFQAVRGRLHQNQPAVHVVEHGARHLVGRPGAVVQGFGVVGERLPALGGSLTAPGHDGLQLGILVCASNGLGKVGLLLVGQVAQDPGSPGKDTGQGLHIALCIVDMYAVLLQFIGAALGVGGKAGHNCIQGRASLAALNTGIGHGSQNCGGFLDRVAEGGGGGCTRLVCLAQLDHVRVGVSHGVGHHIDKVRSVRGFQTKGGQIVGDNIGCLRQIHVGGSSQIQHRADALQHRLGVPACQSHVGQSISRFASGEFRGCAHFLGLVGQSRQLLTGSTGEGLDIAHGCFKITCGVDAVHVGIPDFSEGL